MKTVLAFAIPITMAIYLAVSLIMGSVGVAEGIHPGECEYNRAVYFVFPAYIAGCELGKQRDWGSK